MDRSLVLLSGGVDSAVALGWAKAQGWSVSALSFDYHNRPAKERQAVELLAIRAGIPPVQYVDLPFLTEIDDLRDVPLANAALRASPEGYIPARNLIFYGLAAYYAELDAVRYVVGGHNGTDPDSFPDAGRPFFELLNHVYRLSLWSYDTTPLEVVMPLAGMSKEEVVRMGAALHVPFEATWSCYWDRDVHCGTCASCRERRDAFAAAGIEDPLPYAD